MSTATAPKPNNTERNNQIPESLRESSTDPQPRRGSTSEWKHTCWYLGGALLFLAITGGVEWANRPASIKEFGRVGEEFYGDFVDPTLATSLEVFVFDADTVKAREFRVERLDNGRWVIPSHHNYPTDAEEQLAKTAASVIGIRRGAMVTRWEADHAHFGVVNPKQDALNVDEVEGVGQRLILRGEDDSVLADYIVGKQVDGESDQYYVRHPDEDEVYIAKLDIDLSTRFTDWIETDLFDVSSGEILRLTVNDYSFDELSGKVTESEVTELSREKTWSDDWKLDSFDEESEELDKDAIRDTLSAIADLEIAGVRKKQQGLTPELALDRSVLSSQRDVDRLQSDLLTRGFLLQNGETEDSLRLISREGELYAGTDEGLVYRMHFGRVFTGSQEELEVGFTAGTETSEADTSQTAIVESEDTGNDGGTDEEAEASGEESKSDDSPASEESTRPGRYVFVRVDFDKTLLGEEPGKPTEPTKPAELIAAEEAEAQADASDSDDPATKRSESDDADSSDADSEESTDDADEEESELDKLRKQYDEARKQYDEDLETYEDFQRKVEEGQTKAGELNRRFAEWYYVIPGESYDKLSLTRSKLVKAEESADEIEASDEDADYDTSTAESTSQTEAETNDTEQEVEADAVELTEGSTADSEESEGDAAESSADE